MIEWLMQKLHRAPAPRPPADQKEAERELRQAQRVLRKSEGEAAQAHQLAGHLRKVNEENHFAERALLAFKGILHD